MIRICSAAVLVALSITPIFAAEPDGLILPPGFHATVVAEGVGHARHIAIRSNGDIYISTNHGKNDPSVGLIAIRLGPDHRAADIEHFSDIDGGTGIRIEGNALYTASPTAVYRFEFSGNALVPAGMPQTIVDGMPSDGFGNRPIAFDGKGNLFIGVGANANLCAEENTPKGAKPVGLKPCPALATRGGIWRFATAKGPQHFPANGEKLATGIRDIDALDYEPSANAVYAVIHDRNGTASTWPDLVSAADEDAIAEEMHRIVKGANLGWPYTYYDSARKTRLLAPEYGGDGKTPATGGDYSEPALAFSGHRAPLDLLFYHGKNFPAKYRSGAFVVFHGGSGPHVSTGRNGYDIMFVHFNKKGVAGAAEEFAEGFAGSAPDAKNSDSAAYRPVGAAVGPDGALYVSDSQKGRIWRISYGN